MTEKQEKIVNAALELFAKEGYKATSTSRIAKEAKVSEGLIFRHYENKEGLLQAIIQQGEDRIKVLFADIVLESDPKEVIRKTIDTFNKVNKKPEEASFWKLQYKIKWETEVYGEHKIEPLQKALEKAFEELEYDQPALEAQLLLSTMDGLATRFYLQHEGFDIEQHIELLKKKYNV